MAKEKVNEAETEEEKNLYSKLKRVGKKFRGRKQEKVSKKQMKRLQKGTKRRAVGARKLLTAMAVIQPKKKGPGRPFKSYKHGLPIHIYKKQQAQQRALYAQYQAQQRMNLRRRGLTPEQITQLQQARTIEEFQRQPRGRLPSQVVRKPSQRPRVERQTKVSNEQGYPQPPPNVADDELRFKKWMADKTVSPNTQRLLTQIRRIQNKGKVDNIEQQRRHWERRLVGANTNLMRAHENMNPVKLDFTGVDPEENILMAPSVFKENPEDNILRTNRHNIMQTREAGNNLKFF